MNPLYTMSNALVGVHSFDVSIRDAFTATTKKIKEAVTSPLGQEVIGFGVGVGSHKIYLPLTEKILKLFGVSLILSTPFRGLSLTCKILLTPFVCVLGPALEEVMFRGDLQQKLKYQLRSFYVNKGFSDSAANTAARVTSVFFASFIFGVIHFTNAILFFCNPVLFLPQVVVGTILGLLFGFVKEFSGELRIPIAMHIGNNTRAWAYSIKASL